MTRFLVVGDLNLDIFVTDLQSDVSPGEVLSPIHVRAGGAAGTFAWTAATRGASVRFIGAVGRDPAGDLLVRWLQEAKVDTRVFRTPTPTGAVLTLERNREHRVMCSRGANGDLTVHRAALSDALSGVDHLHVSGYAFLFDRQLKIAEAAIAEASVRGIPISTAPPPAGRIETFGVDRLLAASAQAAYVFPNRQEGAVLAGVSDPQAVVDALQSRFPRGALTLGEEGAIAWIEDERCRVPAHRVATQDTVGAGDTFAAAFLVSWYASHDCATAVRDGCAAAHDLLRHRAQSTP